jgi:exodeoxyribonuclease VII small subunit
MAKKKVESLSPEAEAYAPTFEEAAGRLEEIVRQLEDGELSLGDSLAAYEEGVKHLKTCFDALSDAERKIELLAGFDSAGNPITQPFDDAATAGPSQVARRSRAETPDCAASDEVDERRELF